MKKTGIISIDEQAVNYRNIGLGRIAPFTLYRSSHPIRDNKQADEIYRLATSNHINSIINLCDTFSGIQSKALYAPWYNTLLQNSRVIALGMDFSITSEYFKRKLKEALQFIIKTEGPWLIHCHAGVDRTGFVCMVIESFMGAKLDEVINDYLLSFNNGFVSSIHSSQKADSLTAYQVLSVMSESQKITEQNLQHIAEIYLRSKIGLTAEETEVLKRKLQGEKLWKQ